MIQEHFDVLKFAVEQGYAEHIEIHYNTNGTQFPEEHIELWKHFKQIEIAFSIDNVGKRFEVERHGAKWDEVEANINKFHKLRETWPQLKTQVCMTINIQNIYYLDELCEWVAKQNFDYDYFNMMHDPQEMNIGGLQPEAKDAVIAKLESANFAPKHRKEIDKIIQFIRNGQSMPPDKFIGRMKQMDEYRKEDFSETHSEISKIIGYK
jgi:MoaA/NifB/PqqE/SkfB family radical SAM enzyme